MPAHVQARQNAPKSLSATIEESYWEEIASHGGLLYDGTGAARKHVEKALVHLDDRHGMADHAIVLCPDMHRNLLHVAAEQMLNTQFKKDKSSILMKLLELCTVMKKLKQTRQVHQ